MYAIMILQQTTRIGHPLLGVIIPGTILLISLILTWLLFRKFSQEE